MKLTPTTIVLSLLIYGQQVVSKACNVFENECVSLHRGDNCQASGLLTDFVPTCEGNCFQFDSFDSVLVRGSGFKGTDCHIFSDINCQNEIVDSGNEEREHCESAPGAQSMRCFFDC
ncbi:hypothetical protein C8J57DRAFT_1585400 [Mycena rebaudengoi]|nr:hypothetical protein C8J57DRAFT_1585400 [Mycena rebaudengoi]